MEKAYTLRTMQIARTFTLKTVDGLTDKEFRAVPGGFHNNILWNCGHVLHAQALFTYGLAGKPLPVPEEYGKLFGTGTSPAKWDAPPAVDAVLEGLRTLGDRIIRDDEAGAFAEFSPFPLFDGVSLNSVEEALSFHCFHEGVHLGAILALKRFVR